MQIFEGKNMFGKIEGNSIPVFASKTESNSDNQKKLASWINAQSDQFREMVEQIRENVHCINSSPVVIKNTGIQLISEINKIAMMIGFSTLLGSLTETDKRSKRVAWPISVSKNLEKRQFYTFSEHNQDAKLHTDSQYLKYPEEVVSLWSIRPDISGKGLSYYANIQNIVHEMSTSIEGQESLQIFEKENIPFRVPSAFTQDPDSKIPEVIYGKVLAQNSFIRYREDTIQAGYKAINQKIPPEIKKALNVIALAMHKVQSDFFLLEAGDVLWINNHNHLHARTEFSDLDRLLFRIRYNFTQKQ